MSQLIIAALTASEIPELPSKLEQVLDYSKINLHYLLNKQLENF